MRQGSKGMHGATVVARFVSLRGQTNLSHSQPPGPLARALPAWAALRLSSALSMGACH